MPYVLNIDMSRRGGYTDTGTFIPDIDIRKQKEERPMPTAFRAESVSE